MKVLRENGRIDRRAATNSKWYQLTKDSTKINTTTIISKDHSSEASSSGSSMSSSDVSFDDDSFKSDDSYYDEDEEFEVACINLEQ